MEQTMTLSSILSGVFRTIQLKARTRQARPRIVFQRATRPPRLKVEATYELPFSTGSANSTASNRNLT